MMAVEDFFEAFIVMDYVSRPDGQGGIEYVHQEGAEFRGGIHANSTTEAEIAYRSGTKTIYTITTLTGVELEQNDVVKRLRDGRLYRITGNAIDNTAPDMAQAARIRQVSAEVMQ